MGIVAEVKKKRREILRTWKIERRRYNHSRLKKRIKEMKEKEGAMKWKEERLS